MDSSKTKKVVIILPAYNAEKTLKATVSEIPVGCYDEIVLVDDFSMDNTVTLAKELGIKHIIKHDKNLGYGANQKSCYRKALELGADIIVMLHPDYQYDPKIVPSLTVPLLYGYADIVLASRILGDPHYGGPLKNKMPVYKYISNKFLTAFQNILTGMHLSEYHTGYRAYSRNALKAVSFESLSDDYIFDNEILLNFIAKGFVFKEVPVKTHYFEEASSINFLQSLKYGLKVVVNTIKFARENRTSNV